MPAERQLSLPLPAPPAEGESPLVPARMVNEWIYCPRLAYLEWVDGAWAETGDTAEGRRVHARVDAGGPGLAPPPDDADRAAGEEEEVRARARSVTLSSERLGLIAKIDVVETEGDAVTPVDFKKGRRPHVAQGAYEPERVQVCAQALVLEDNGYRVAGAALWYAGSRERVRVELDEALRATTQAAISDLRLAAASAKPPPPLEDSPKCVRCALAGICLPDEVNFFRGGQTVRPLAPADEPALPLYVQSPGARVARRGETLRVSLPSGEEGPETKREVPLIAVSDLALFGPVSLTTPALHELLRREIPVTWLSGGGWFLGHTLALGKSQADLRAAQWRASFDAVASLRLARGLVVAKIRNTRSFLRRNWKRTEGVPATAREPMGDREAGLAPGRGGTDSRRAAAMAELKRLAKRAESARGQAELLGLEGQAAAVYFRYFAMMLAADRRGGGAGARAGARPEAGIQAGTEAASRSGFGGFAFDKRNRRPPTDPINAMLSFCYALLARSLTVALATAGFDPYRGFYHRPRHGRPALALDLMEPFRPILADSAVVMAINNGEVRPNGFVWSGSACALKPAARKALIAAYERRLDQQTTHPLFGYRVTLRRLLAVQVRLLGRHLRGEIPEYPHYLPR